MDDKKIPVSPVRVQPFAGDAFQGMREAIGKAAKKEAARQLDKLITTQQQGQNDMAFIAKLNNDLTIATDANGNEYSVLPVGDISTEHVPFFKMSGTRGVAYSPDTVQMSVDGSEKLGHVAVLVGNSVYVRQLGAESLSLVYTVPSEIPTANIQGLFSGNAKHFMVGWWWKQTVAPYWSYATYIIFEDFRIDGDGNFVYSDIQTDTVSLNGPSNGLAIPPAFNTPMASYIWFNRPPVDGPGGDYARFFPIVTSYYNTVTDPYEYTYTPEWPLNFTRQSMTQDGNYSANWYLDTNTLADFRSVKFAFNNKENGDPTVDIVCAYRAITVGMMLNQVSTDDQGVNIFNSITYFDGTLAGTLDDRAHYIQYVLGSWDYNYDYNYIGENFTYTATQTSTEYDNWVQTDDQYSQTSVDNPDGNYSRNGGSKLYPFVAANPDDPPPPYLEEYYGDGSVWANNAAYRTYVGTIGNPYVFLNPPDRTTFLLTTYDGVEKTASTVVNPAGYVNFPEVFAFIRPDNQTAGWYTNEYYQYTITPQGPFARDYYFAKIIMVVEDANGTRQVKFNNGEPPLTENDYNIIEIPYRGVNRTTALAYQQTSYPTETVYVNPENDASFQAILEILRESGLDALADYLESHPIAGTLDIQTKQVYWYAGSYYNQPFYGYDNEYDVITDAVVAPGGTFPFPGSYFKGVDSYAIVGYNGSDGDYETVTLYQVAESGLTTINSRARKRKNNSEGTLLDVAIRYGSVD